MEKKVVENDAEVTKLDENLLGMEETLKMLAEKTSKMYIDGVLPQAIQNRVSTKEERLQCGFPLLPVPEGDADGAQASKARMVVSKMMWAVAREGERATPEFVVKLMREMLPREMATYFLESDAEDSEEDDVPLSVRRLSAGNSTGTPSKSATGSPSKSAGKAVVKASGAASVPSAKKPKLSKEIHVKQRKDLRTLLKNFLREKQTVKGKDDKHRSHVWMWEIHLEIAKHFGAKFYKDALLHMANGFASSPKEKFEGKSEDSVMAEVTFYSAVHLNYQEVFFPWKKSHLFLGIACPREIDYPALERSRDRRLPTLTSLDFASSPAFDATLRPGAAPFLGTARIPSLATLRLCGKHSE